MGFIPASTLTTDTSYSVAVNAGDILSINGENEPRIYFTQGQKYLFEQSDATNQEYRLTFPYYDTGSGTWIDTNTGITPHGVPGRNGAYTYFEPDALADLTRVCLVKDDVRKTTLIAPIVTIDDISFGVLGKAYSGIPFTVTFTSGIDDGSFSITDANGGAIALASPTATDLSYGTSSIEVTIGTDVLSGVMTIGGTNGITQTFDYVSIAQTFVVTIGQSSGNDVFLVDGAVNVELGLENGKSYMFDLSYSENYTFGLATEIDGANSSAYTNNITNVSNYMIVQNVSASSTLYYYAVGYSNMGSDKYQNTRNVVTQEKVFNSPSDFKTISMSPSISIPGNADFRIFISFKIQASVNSWELIAMFGNDPYLATVGDNVDDWTLFTPIGRFELPIRLSNLYGVTTEIEIIREGGSRKLTVNGTDYSSTAVDTTQDAAWIIQNTEQFDIGSVGLSYNSTGSYFKGSIYEITIQW
jgi:hypothetical protein